MGDPPFDAIVQQSILSCVDVETPKSDVGGRVGVAGTSAKTNPLDYDKVHPYTLQTSTLNQKVLPTLKAGNVVVACYV